MILLDLIEDEALLALPQSPKHEVCPDTGLLDKLKTEKPSAVRGAQGPQIRIRVAVGRDVSNACS
jgi:uncharacterized protein